MKDYQENKWCLPEGCEPGMLVIRKVGIHHYFNHDYSFCHEPYVFEGLEGKNMLVRDMEGEPHTVTQYYNDGNWALLEDILNISFSLFAWAYGYEIYHIFEKNEKSGLCSADSIGILKFGGDYHLILEEEDEEFIWLLEEIDPTDLLVSVNGIMIPLVLDHPFFLFDSSRELFE